MKRPIRFSSLGERRAAFIALVVATGLIAVAFALPAFGGPSLKSLVKKEVKKQLAGRTGPPGAAGAAGGPGAAGAAGPGAVKLTFDQPETDNQTRSAGTVGEVTVLARCTTAAGITRLIVSLQSSGSQWIARGTNGVSTNGTTVALGAPIDVAVVVAPSSMTILDFTPGVSGDSRQSFVQLTIFFSSLRVITMQLYAEADDGNDRCQLHGTAVPAS